MSLLPLSHDHVDAVLFDPDGALTDSAALHAKSWKRLFDDALHNRDGERFCPFDADLDYRRFVDGKPRYDGIRSFEVGIETADFPALPITVGCQGNVFELEPGSSRKIDL